MKALRTEEEALKCKFLQLAQWYQGGFNYDVFLGFRCQNRKAFEKIAQKIDKERENLQKKYMEALKYDIEYFEKEKERLEKKKKLKNQEAEKLQNTKEMLAEKKQLLTDMLNLQPWASASTNPSYCRFCSHWEENK